MQQQRAWLIWVVMGCPYTGVTYNDNAKMLFTTYQQHPKSFGKDVYTLSTTPEGNAPDLTNNICKSTKSGSVIEFENPYALQPAKHDKGST